MKIGSLFSGYGGLDMGVQSVIGGEVAWHVEFDPAPSKILAHRFPGVPNYGDITKVDWSAVEPVDVLTGGFPCQDVSLAGLRRGLKEGTRSGLWSEFAQAIGHLRPGLVVIENVRGLLSAVAAGPVESDPWGLGDGSARPSLRALGAVLGDLADLGYDTRWCGVRAADAGAPHGRFRVFVLAYPTGQRWGEGRTEPARRERRSEAERSGAPSDASSKSWSVGNGNDVRAGGGTLGRREAAGAGSLEDSDLATRSEWGQSAPRQAEGRRPWSDARGRGGASAADAAGGGRDGWSQDEVGETVRRTPVAWGRGGIDTASDTSGERFWQYPGEPSEEEAGQVGGDLANGVGGSRSAQDWGPYRPAITRWENRLGRRAPNPTRADGKANAHRLNPQFVEWMMGLPEGWLTAPEVGLTRAQQLKALGNGVVPQQAALAVRTLLQAEEVAA